MGGLIMEKKMDYKNQPLGFDRTQLYKEYNNPQITRSAGLRMAMDMMIAHECKWSMSQLILVSDRIIQYYELNDKTWVTKMDDYFKLKKDEQLEKILNDGTK
jgi:hypothetical protein